MKTYIKNIFLAGGALLLMTGCDDNSWNDKLDGFDPNPGITDVRTIDYTLTAHDYTRISKNYRNVAKAKAAGLEDELEAVGTLGYLNQEITPAEYIPALLKDSLFAYYGLSQGSAINITYQVASNLPKTMIGLNAADTYKVSTADYQMAYDSDEDYAESFSPSAPASYFLPRILEANMQDAEAGDYVLVSYNNSDTDPVFTKAPFEMTDVIKDAKKGDELKAKGVVTGVCAQGFVLSDKSGSILVYFGKDYDGSYAIGDQVEASGEIGAFNGGLQFTATGMYKKVGKAEDVTYPAPVDIDGAYLDAALDRTGDHLGIYVKFTGKATIGEKNSNFDLAGATKATGSFYQLTAEQKAQMESDKEYTVEGYFLSVSKSKDVPKYVNVLPVKISPAAAAASAKRGPRKVASVPTTAVNAMYQFNGSKWSEVSNVCVLQASDYTKMGVSGNALTLDQATQFIPLFMANNYPYAEKDAVKYVVYNYTDGTNTTLRSEEYTYTDGAWVNSVSHGGVITETNQFVYKPTGWKMDPSIELTLPAGKNQPTSTWFFQTCVDWVKANAGAVWVTSYGTNEYYCGTSAYQGNVDLRASSAITQNPDGYAGMSNDEIVALMKKRFEEEVCPGALAVLYPKINVVDGVDVTVTIHFSAYNGSSTQEYVIYYNVIGKAQFEFVSCTWNDASAE